MKTIQQLLAFAVFFVVTVSSSAQCVMCSAAVESNKVDGGITGAGINVGVAYLSFFPYMILGVIGYIMYRKYKMDQKENQ